MKLLLTMAGLGSRFKSAGYTDEKYAIEFRGHTLLEWSLASLCNFRQCPLILITRDFEGIEATLTETCDRLGFEDRRIIVIDRVTRGQAETAILAEPCFESDDSILIFNTDTFVDPNFLRPEDIRGSAWIPTFKAPGDKWSFVEADDEGRIIRTTEKQRISNNCSIGAYYFDSFFEFKSLVDKAQETGELYVAPLYNDWLSTHPEGFLHRLPSHSVTILGTPEDLELANQLELPVWPKSCVGKPELDAPIER